MADSLYLKHILYRLDLENGL